MQHGGMGAHLLARAQSIARFARCQWHDKSTPIRLNVLPVHCGRQPYVQLVGVLVVWNRQMTIA